MGVELAPVKAMLDETHPSLPTQRDQNSYTLGEMGGHNVVIAVLPEIGTNSAATVAIQLLNDFPAIRFGLLVGIGGGVPSEEEDGDDVRLGDVVVSKPTATFGGVVQYDLGKYLTSGGFERTGVLAKPPILLRTSVETLAADHRIKGSRVPQYLFEMLRRYPTMVEEYSHPGAQTDQLFQADYPHLGGPTCRNCDAKRTVNRDDRKNNSPRFHYGTIGSANTVVKDAGLREELRRVLKIKCVEMEAAGLMDSFPCLVIRGICDYADSHKNKKWQPYAAATAAAYMKELLSIIPGQEVTKIPNATVVVEISQYDKGLNLFDAPIMADDLFIGREPEFQDMIRLLQPRSDSPGSTRKVLILGGMGGIGKTQLAISYAKRRGNSYSSVFWLDASSTATLSASFRNVAYRIFPLEMVRKLDDEDQLRIHVCNWLSDPDNARWLLIFDNYDEPDRYDITKYYAPRSHGSIIVTTRQPRRLNGEKIKVESMAKLEDGLAILATRSGRGEVQSDPGAQQLVKRLDGFPLALATAGAFLKESAVSFSKYLQQYEARWEVIPGEVEELPDYPTRTLYTTWNLSLAQIKERNPRAAELLCFLAYLSHQDLWYELFCAGQDEERPSWFAAMICDEFAFEKAMDTLTRYCLVEAHPQNGSYSLHVCVHDWTLNSLNRHINIDQYWLAVDCVTGPISGVEWSDLAALEYRRLNPHAERLAHNLFREVVKQHYLSPERLDKLGQMAGLLTQQVQHQAAERMYLQALAGKEKALGPEHTSTLHTVHGLGTLYADQGKLAQAEQMYARALAGNEKALGPEHTSTLDTVHGLGILYRNQGKLAQAEQMYARALAGNEKALGPEHTSTLDTVNNLGTLYADQGKLAQAEQMYARALAGNEKALGPEHTSTLDTVHGLGTLYADQGKLAQAEQMYARALAGNEKALGPEHTSTLDTVHGLGILYRNQGKLAQAEQMYARALAGNEKALGPEHTSTLDTVHSLGILYADQGKLAQAEQMYARALAGKEKALGPEHTSTLDTVHNLGTLYADQGKLAQAEQMYARALAGKEKALGPEHTSTLHTVNNLGLLYKDQGKLAQAEQMYARALAGYDEAALSLTVPALNTVGNLGLLYRDQGKIEQARNMLQRAALGREKVLGPQHPHTLELVDHLRQLDDRPRKRNRLKNLLPLKK